MHFISIINQNILLETENLCFYLKFEITDVTSLR